MISRIVIYLTLLISSFVFSVYYYAWFSWFLFILVVSVPIVSLLVSLPFMISGAASGIVMLGRENISINDPTALCFKSKSGRGFFAPFLKIKIKYSNGFSGIGGKVKFTHSGALKEPVFVNSDKAFADCGSLKLEAAWGRIYDFTGIFFIPIKIKQTLDINILPKPEKPEVMPDSSLLTVTGYKAKPGGGFSDIYELREYRSGDSLKQIHWKLSGKYDELIVREPSVEVYRNMIVKIALTDDPKTNNNILARFLYAAQYLQRKGITFFAECERTSTLCEIKPRDSIWEFFKLIYTFSRGGAADFGGNAASYLIFDGGEVMSV